MVYREKKVGYFNQEFAYIEGTREFLTYYESSSLHMDNFMDFVRPEDYETVTNAFKEGDKTKNFLIKLRRNDGIYHENLVTFETCDHGNCKNVCRIQTTDIDDMLKINDYRSMEEQKLKKALCLTNEFMFNYDKGTNFITIYEYTQNRRIVLYNDDIYTWMDLMIRDNLVPENQLKAFQALVTDLTECPASFMSKLTCGIRSGNPDLLEKVRFSGVRFDDIEQSCMIGRILTEEQVKKTNHVKNLIGELQIDALTQVFNKKTITKLINDKILENRDDQIALIIVDLDHFKPVNDQYGHMAGDGVLVEAGRILKEIVGEDGVVGRFGGDEFMIMAYGIDSDDVLRGILRSILTNVKLAFENSFEDIKITASIGAAVHPKNGQTYEELFKKADFCLYRAKDKGRDRYVFYRDDLHKAEFEKADAAKTAGIKYDGREMQEIKYFAQFIRELDKEPEKAIPEVLQHMIDTYSLDSINIYYGKEMKRIYHQGSIDNGFGDAAYVNDPKFRELLGDKDYLRMDFWTDFTDKDNFLLVNMQERKVFSTMHCIIGTPDNIKGLVTFDRVKAPALFAEYEVHCCNIFASCLNLAKQNVIMTLLEGI